MVFQICVKENSVVGFASGLWLVQPGIGMLGPSPEVLGMARSIFSVGNGLSTCGYWVGSFWYVFNSLFSIRWNLCNTEGRGLLCLEKLDCMFQCNLRFHVFSITVRLSRLFYFSKLPLFFLPFVTFIFPGHEATRAIQYSKFKGTPQILWTCNLQPANYTLALY